METTKTVIKGADGLYRSNANLRLRASESKPGKQYLNLRDYGIESETQIPSQITVHFLLEKCPVKNHRCEVCNDARYSFKRRMKILKVTDNSGRIIHPRYAEERKIFSEIIGKVRELFHHETIVCEACY